MNMQSLSLYTSLIRQFRDAPRLIGCIRSGHGSDSATTWSGRVLTHPQGRAGFLDALLEHWVFETYMQGSFYRPAPDDVVLDIGAHIGLFSIQLARKFRHVQVLSFEPSDETFQHLLANLKSFDCSNVRPFRIALGRAKEQGVIVEGKRTLDNQIHVSESEDSFPIVPLRDILRLSGERKIALMKVDIEGSEKEAFESIEQAELANIERIIVEYHDNLIPGCLDSVRRSLSNTHEISIEASSVPGCGLLRGKLALHGKPITGAEDTGRCV